MSDIDLETRNQKLCEMYRSGSTIPQISQQTGLSCSQLSRIFKKYGAKRKKYELDRDYFEANRDKTTRQISEETGLSAKRVNHLKRVAYGGKLSKGATDFSGGEPEVDPGLIDDVSWLHEQYVIQRNGAPTIARMLATKCSRIYQALKKHGIQRRTVRTMMEDKKKWPSKEWLEQNYIKNAWSISRCAKERGIGWMSIYGALKHHKIRIRSASEQHLGDLNEFFGKSHPDEIRSQCSAVGSKYGSKYWVTGDVEAKIEAARVRSVEVWSDPAMRSESSKRISELCKKGACNPKQQIFQCRDGSVLFLKSSWELLVAKTLDNCDVVDDWKYESVSIEYMDGDVVRNFVIDFWVRWSDGLESLIECKNEHLLNNPKEKLKISAAEEYCDRHKIGLILIGDREQVKKMTAGYRSLVEWRNDTRYKVSRKYLEEPKFFVEIMFHEIIEKSCPWKPLKYCRDELSRDLDRLKKENLSAYHQKDGIHSTAPNSGGMPGRIIMTHFNPHFWDVPPRRQQPLPRAFDDRRLVHRCLHISYSENESLSTERLLREINFHGRKFGRTSHFAPGFARTIIRLCGMSGSRMFDPCCGWGGRLLGAWLEGCEYSGCDLSQKTHRGLISIAQHVGMDADIRNCSCVDVDWVGNFILTSPPFYDTEKYLGDDQPWKICKSRNEWIDKFISPFVGKIDVTPCALYLDGKTRDDFESIRKFDSTIEIKNRRHARKQMDSEWLCIYNLDL